MKNIIKRKIEVELEALEEAWAGYHAEKDPWYQDLYIADIETAMEEIGRLESLLREPVVLENRLPL